MTEIRYYGFLYQHDPRVGASSGEFQCETEFGRDMGRVPLKDPDAWTGYKKINKNEAPTRILVTETDDEATIEAALGKTMTGVESEEQDHDEDVIDRVAQNTTVSNLDTLCKSDSKFLFKDEAAYAEMDDLFHEYCYEKSECVIDLENLPVRPFSEMLSDFCRIRMYGYDGTEEEAKGMPEEEWHKPQITSTEFLVVVGCMGSTYKINGFVLHKQQYACLLVIIDFIGVLFMLYVFDKLQALN
jgi:hypothetical protein